MASVCSSCGAELLENAAFCPKCGKATAVQGTIGGAAAAPSTSASATPTTATAGTGLQDNIAGLLAYLVIPAVIFLVVEPYNRNRFVRFHSFQAIALWVVCVVLNIVIGMFPIINIFLLPLLGLAELILGIVCMIKAYQNQYFKLPVIGEFAEKQANG